MITALEAATGQRVTSVERRPSAYRTSFALEEVDATLADGSRVELVLKHLHAGALTPAARAAKPDRLLDPAREIEVYEQLLPDAGLGTARCYASGPDWLLLERVRGVELYQVGSRRTWEHVAGALARLHAALADRPTPRMVRHDAELLRSWAPRAAAFTGSADLERIAAGYEPVVERLLALPAGVIHGEHYASNVLVDDPEAPDRVCPVDWEMAGVGPFLLDVAALVSGAGWRDEDRAAIAAAYGDAPAAALDACRLHLAVQWLGWAEGWTPPREHATDWLREAVELAERLGIGR